MKNISINTTVWAILLCSGVVGMLGCSMGLVHTNQTDFNNKIVYSLPKAYIKLVNDQSGCKVETIYEPDEHHYYLLKYTTNIGFDDDITIQVNEKGFLSSIQVTTTSKFPEIIKKITEIAVEALKVPIKTSHIKLFELMLDPTELDEYNPGTFNEAIRSLLTLKEAPPGSLDTKKAAIRLSESGGKLYRNFNIAHISLEHPKANFLYEGPNQSAAERPPAENRGICYRPALPFKLRLLVGDVYIERVVYLPNYSKLVTFDINRPAFVQKIQGLTFTNGLLTQVHLKKDSELLAGLGIPADLVKTVAGLPLELIKFKTENMQGENTLLQTQINQIQLERELQKLKEAKSSSAK
jgi:hypothetical protein